MALMKSLNIEHRRAIVVRGHAGQFRCGDGNSRNAIHWVIIRAHWCGSPSGCRELIRRVWWPGIRIGRMVWRVASSELLGQNDGGPATQGEASGSSRPLIRVAHCIRLQPSQCVWPFSARTAIVVAGFAAWPVLPRRWQPLKASSDPAVQERKVSARTMHVVSFC